MINLTKDIEDKIIKQIRSFQRKFALMHILEGTKKA